MRTCVNLLLFYLTISIASIFLLFASWSSANSTWQSAEQTGINSGNQVLSQYGSKSGVNTNISVPLTTNTLQHTIDGSQSFNAQINCLSGDVLSEIMIQPSGTGDISYILANFHDKNSNLIYAYTVPVSVSGVCANGIISCDPGTWNNCNYYEWILNPKSSLLEIKQTDIYSLGGCYCINNSCGSSLVWNNLSQVLKDLGGGIVTAHLSFDSQTIISEVKVDGTTISYYGLDAYKCSQQNTGSAAQYYKNPYSMSTGSQSAVLSQSSQSGSNYNLLLAANSSSSGNFKTCKITRTIAPSNFYEKDILEPVGGSGRVNNCGYGCIDVLLGSQYNINLSGYCDVFEDDYTYKVHKPGYIKKVELVRVEWNDYIQVWVNSMQNNRAINTRVFAGKGAPLSGPPGTFTIVPNDPFPFPVGSGCDETNGWIEEPFLDITGYFNHTGNIELKASTLVMNKGDGYVQIRILLDCTGIENVSDSCSQLDTDPNCRLKEEYVDGVLTVEDFVSTGLLPLSSCKYQCGNVCRDWWEKVKTYDCSGSGSGFNHTDKLHRAGSVVSSAGLSSQNILSYTNTQKQGGTWVSAPAQINLPTTNLSSASCDHSCKVSRPVVNTTATSSGNAALYLASQATYEIIYKKCQNNVCPVGTGETLLIDCQCLNEFTAAAVYIWVLDYAGHDMICTAQ